MSRDEHAHQKAVIDWWAYECRTWSIPEFALYAVPNGGARHVVVAKKLRAEGVRPGIPDLVLAFPAHGFHGLYVEMKDPKGRESESQRAVIRYLVEVGYHAAFAYGSMAAIAEIRRYLGGPLAKQIAGA